MSTGGHGFGIKFYLGGEAIGSVVSVARPEGASRAVYDVTTFDEAPSTDGVVWRRFRGSQTADAGSFEFDLLLDPDKEFTLGTGDPVAFSIRHRPTGQQTKGAEWAGSGIVQSNDEAYPVDDKMMRTVRVKLDGKLTVTAGSDTVVAA